MLKNISDKDLRLLVFMFLVVVVAGLGYWGIRPQLKAYINMKEEIEEQQATAELNDLKLMNMMMVSAMADEYEEKIAKRKNEFYPMMKSSEVDQMMTAMAHERNLEIFELRFSMPTDPSTRMAYQYSELYKEQLQARDRFAALSPVMPELKKALDSIDDYTHVFVCGPCWWGTFPTAVFTQLEMLNWKGKKVMALMTHEGSGLGLSEKDLKKTCSGASFGKGLAVQGAQAQESGSRITAWAKKMV